MFIGPGWRRKITPTGPCLNFSAGAGSFICSGLQYGIMYMPADALPLRIAAPTSSSLAKPLQSGVCQNFRTMCRILLAMNTITADNRIGIHNCANETIAFLPRVRETLTNPGFRHSRESGNPFSDFSQPPKINMEPRFCVDDEL